MKMRDGFEIVNIAEEYMVVPVGEKAEEFKGMVVLNAAAAFLLDKMHDDLNRDELVALLMERYDVDADKANKDVLEMLQTMYSLGLIYD